MRKNCAMVVVSDIMEEVMQYKNSARVGVSPLDIAKF